MAMLKTYILPCILTIKISVVNLFLYLTIHYAPTAWMQGLVKYKRSELPHDVCMCGHNFGIRVLWRKQYQTQLDAYMT